MIKTRYGVDTGTKLRVVCFTLALFVDEFVVFNYGIALVFRVLRLHSILC
jgi:hypothetical protein